MAGRKGYPDFPTRNVEEPRNSILAIGIASLFIICAAAGAIIVANDSNNNNTDVSDSSNSVTVYRSFSSATAEKDTNSMVKVDNERILKEDCLKITKNGNSIDYLEQARGNVTVALYENSAE